MRRQWQVERLESDISVFGSCDKVHIEIIDMRKAARLMGDEVGQY